MNPLESFLLTRILLNFEDEADEIIGDISAAAFTPDGNLWVGSDEMIGIERLSPVGKHSYGNHQRFLLKDYVELFNTDDEVDIEGMDFAGGYLWITGSHSTKRKKPKGKKDAIERLATVTTDLNRFIFARIPVINGELVKSCTPKNGEPLTAACLQTIDNRNLLWEVLKEDVHLKPFVAAGIPSKDNGLDIEGLAVRGDRLFVGLRGPVLRGWAIVLEMEFESSEPGVLTFKTIGDDDTKYIKHFLDLNGLGVRELCFHDEDLIVLAGPTMDLEGEMELFRWKDPLGNGESGVYEQDEDVLVPLFDLPFTVGYDHAEGLALYSYLEDNDSITIFYDSPNPKRVKGEKSIFVDVFQL